MTIDMFTCHIVKLILSDKKYITCQNIIYLCVKMSYVEIFTCQYVKNVLMHS